MITVLLFASIADALGTRKLRFGVRPGDTVAAVRDRLIEEYPKLKPFAENLMYAVDEEYARPETPVAEGATLALIPPVSGGCE
jgi:molybdopterin converting factor subunit 1